MLRSTLSVIFLLLSFLGKSNKIDSLENVLLTEKNDSVIFVIYTQIIGETLNNDAEKALELSKKQFPLATTEKQKATALLNIGLSYDYLYNFKEAIESYHLALKKFEVINDSAGVCKVLLNLGIVNYYKGDYDSSIYYYVETIKRAEIINLNRTLGSAIANLGILHSDLGEYDLALKYQLRSLELDEKNNDKEGMARSYNNIGISYRGLKNYELAREYYQKCIDIRKELKDESGLATAYTNIGQTYFYEGDYDKAIEFNQMSVELDKKNNDIVGYSECYVNIGESYLKLGKHQLAIFYLEKSYEVLDSLKINKPLTAVLEGLSLAYSKVGDYEKAYFANRRYAALQDSLYVESRMKQVKELETKYNIEHTEKENELLKKENTINQLQLSQKENFEQNLMIGLILLGLIILLLIYAYYSNRKSRKKLALRNYKIELMNTDLTSKNKEITDSIVYAKRIQEAILPQDKLMKSYFNESFVLYKPKDIVSGDFYWMEKVANTLLFAAVDCTGHGVPGAFMSIVGHNGLNRAVREHNKTNPKDILDDLNEHVERSVQKSGNDVVDGMDIALCTLDLESNKLNFSGAFNPLYMVRNGELLIIESDKQPIGGAKKPFSQNQIQLEKGDVCYIFTDGYADQFGGEKDKKFNRTRFKQTLIDISILPMENQKNELETIFENWKGNQEQLDDICVIGFKI